MAKHCKECYHAPHMAGACPIATIAWKKDGIKVSPVTCTCLSVPPIGQIFYASAEDGCDNCFQSIIKGQLITRTRRDKYAHVNCDESGEIE